jgi:hypothetical protein
MYFSFIRQATEGHWLFVNRLTSLDHQPVLLNVEWFAVGRLIALAGILTALFSAELEPPAQASPAAGRQPVHQPGRRGPRRLRSAEDLLSAPPLLRVRDLSVGFGKQAAGASSTSHAVTLTNTGSNPLTIGSIAASGGFMQTNNCPGSLSAGLNCMINVQFAPPIPGAMAGALTVLDNAGSSPQLVSLTGTGMAPVTFKPATLDLASVAIGNNSSKSVTVVPSSTLPKRLIIPASARMAAAS